MIKIGQSAGNPPKAEILRDYMPGIQCGKGGIMNLKPDWVVGFVDGEGCFFIGVNPHKEMTVGYQILPEFRIVQHERDIQVLYSLKRFFKSGVVRRNHDDRFELRIRKLSSLKEVVTFFEKNPLKTKKSVDFSKFAKVIRLMDKNEHLNINGIKKIISISLSMNNANKSKAKEILSKIDHIG
jgi:hypothetical protein